MSRTLKLATMWKECDAALGMHALDVMPPIANNWIERRPAGCSRFEYLQIDPPCISTSLT